MKKTILSLITASLLIGCGGGGSSGGSSSSGSNGSNSGRNSGSNSGSNSVGSSLPNAHGKAFIQIANNIDKDSAAAKRFASTYMNRSGFINKTTKRTVHCTDYQYSSGDLQFAHGNRLSYTIYGSKTAQICEEFDATGTFAEGSYSIVIAYN